MVANSDFLKEKQAEEIGQELRGPSFWQEQIENYRSGDYKNKAVYCREFKLNYEHFLYWNRRLNASGIKARKLIPVKLKEGEALAKGLCSIELHDGRWLWIHDEKSVEKLIERII